MNDQGSSSFLDVVPSNFGLERFIGRNDARRKLAVMHGNSVRSSLSRCKLRINHRTIHGRNQKLCSSALCVAANFISEVAPWHPWPAWSQSWALLLSLRFSPWRGLVAVKEGRLFSSPPPYGLRMENISFCRDYLFWVVNTRSCVQSSIWAKRIAGSISLASALWMTLWP